MHRIPEKTQPNAMTDKAIRRPQTKASIGRKKPQIGSHADERVFVAESVRFMFELARDGLPLDHQPMVTSRACKTGQS